MNDKKPNVDRFDPRLAAAYSRTENKEQQYDEWAATYDSDLVDDMGYVAHIDAGNVFMEVGPDKDCAILDVACGTGLAGQYLQSHQYTKIDGVDLSTKMLDIARERSIYRHLFQHDFTRPFESENLYDALLCVGMFSYAVPKISDMHNVVNCVHPGASCVITVNGAAWDDLELEEQLEEESSRHGFTVEKIVEAGYIREQGIGSKILVIRR